MMDGAKKGLLAAYPPIEAMAYKHATYCGWVKMGEHVVLEVHCCVDMATVDGKNGPVLFLCSHGAGTTTSRCFLVEVWMCTLA